MKGTTVNESIISLDPKLVQSLVHELPELIVYELPSCYRVGVQAIFHGTGVITAYKPQTAGPHGPQPAQVSWSALGPISSADLALFRSALDLAAVLVEQLNGALQDWKLKEGGSR